MASKSKRLIVVLLILSLAGGMFVFVLSRSTPSRFGDGSVLPFSFGKKTVKPEASSPVVAYLNGKPITRDDIIRQKVFMDSMPGVSPATKAQALQVIVRNSVIYEDAKRRGLAMTLEEARAVVAEQRRMYENGTLPERDRLRQLIAALNVDEKTYWDEIAPRDYAMLMSVTRWYQDMAKSVGIAYVQVGDPTPAEMSRQGTAIDRIVQGLVSKAKLDVVDKEFIGE